MGHTQETGQIKTRQFTTHDYYNNKTLFHIIGQTQERPSFFAIRLLWKIIHTGREKETGKVVFAAAAASQLIQGFLCKHQLHMFSQCFQLRFLLPLSLSSDFSC